MKTKLISTITLTLTLLLSTFNPAWADPYRSPAAKTPNSLRAIYETDLNYYYARYYDPHIQRFIQPDTLLPDIYDPQQLNRYAYARNNPLKYNDPTGHIAFLAIPLAYWVVGAFVGATAYSYTPHGQQVTKAAITKIAEAGSQLISKTIDYGKSIVSNFNNKPANQTSVQQTKNTSPQNNSSPQMQNPLEKIAPLIPGTANAADKIHGNDLRRTAQTWGYTLRDIATGTINKFGETMNPAGRYSQEWLTKNKIYMNLENIGTKAQMRIWEYEQIGDYIFKYGEAPTLNNI